MKPLISFIWLIATLNQYSYAQEMHGPLKSIEQRLYHKPPNYYQIILCDFEIQAVSINVLVLLILIVQIQSAAIKEG